MAGIPWTPKEDQLIKELYPEQSSKDIAARLPGRTTKAVDHRIGKLGLSGERTGLGYKDLRDSFDQALSEQVGEPIGDYLRRRYVVEKATYRELCAELNINTRTLMRRMEQYGITPIDPKTAGRRNYRKNKDVYRHNLTAYRNNDKVVSKIAKTRQGQWSKFSSDNAKAVFFALKEMGFSPIPEYAVYRYNIDLAFPDQKLAVEIDGGNWHTSPVHQKKDNKKESYLTSQGWTVLRVGTPTSYPPVSVFEAVTIISSALKS